MLLGLEKVGCNDRKGICCCDSSQGVLLPQGCDSSCGFPHSCTPVSALSETTWKELENTFARIEITYSVVTVVYSKSLKFLLQ